MGQRLLAAAIPGPRAGITTRTCCRVWREPQIAKDAELAPRSGGAAACPLIPQMAGHLGGEPATAWVNTKIAVTGCETLADLHLQHSPIRLRGHRSLTASHLPGWADSLRPRAADARGPSGRPLRVRGPMVGHCSDDVADALAVDSDLLAGDGRSLDAPAGERDRDRSGGLQLRPVLAARDRDGSPRARPRAVSWPAAVILMVAPEAKAEARLTGRRSAKVATR